MFPNDPEAAWLRSVRAGVRAASTDDLTVWPSSRASPLVGISDTDRSRAGRGVPPLTFLHGAEHVEGVPFEREASLVVLDPERVVPEANLGQGEIEVGRSAAEESR